MASHGSLCPCSIGSTGPVRFGVEGFSVADAAELLRYLVDQRGSDLHLKAGSPPFLRVNGRLQASSLPKITAADTTALIETILPTERAEEFRRSGETDFAMGISGMGRFRVSVIRQRGSAGVVFRRVHTSPPSFDEIGLPPVVRQLAERRKGLVLVTGPSDSGRSTTISTMINHLNERGATSVITVEDPIEVLHADKQSFINQREVGTDTTDHLSGLQRSLRHDPDVLYVDRVPNAEVMGMVLSAASGRLVITSMSSLNSEGTVQRVIDFFPPYQARQTRHALAAVLQGVICQRLLDREDGRGRVAAFEIMVATQRLHDAIVEAPGAQTIESLIAAGDYYGMQTMDQHLAALHKARTISLRDALSSAIHPQDLRVQLQQSGVNTGNPPP